MTMVDISVPLREDMVVWPGEEDFSLTEGQRLEKGDPCNSTSISLGVHTGTHVDAPWHFVEEGEKIDEIDLDVLIGPVYVLDFRSAKEVDAQMLEDSDLPDDALRLLLRTSNSELWSRTDRFRKDYVALTADAARWVVNRGIRCIGIDYLSIQKYDDPPLTHETLLRAGVAILEGLNLNRVPAGQYKLLCLPLRLSGCEAAPARALLFDS